MSRTKRRIRAAALGATTLVVLAGGAALSAAPAAADPPTSGYSLLYQDGFDGTAVNTADWYYRVTSAYGSAKGYMRSQNVTESSGALHLAYTHQDVTGDGVPEFVGGGVLSTHLFGYGYYEIRAKLFDATPGLHSAFWSMGLNTGMTGANGDPRIESDIAASKLPENNQLYEIDGFEQNSPDSLGMGDITWSGGSDSRHAYQSGADWGVDLGDWNVYGYDYTPTTLTFYINGIARYSIPVGTANRPFNPMNFWLTALPYSANPSPSLLPGSTDIDYFKFYGEAHPGVNLLANPSFDIQPESNPGLWIVPGWIEAYDKPASKRETTSTVDGGYALEQSGTAPYQVTTKQNLEYIANGTYTLTAWVRSSGGQNQAALRVLNYGGSELDYDVPATATWTQVSIPNVPVSNGKATIAISSNGTAGQWLQVDKVSFVQQ